MTRGRIAAADLGFEPLRHEFGKLKDTLGEPPSPEQWVKWWNDQREEARKLAELALGGSGGGTGNDPASVDNTSSKERKRMQERLDALRKALGSEDEALRLHLSKQLKDIGEFENLRLISQQEAAQLRRDAEGQNYDKTREVTLTKFASGTEAELELLRNRHERLLEELRRFEENQTVTVEEAERLRQQIREKYDRDRAKIQEASFSQLAGSAKDALQSLTTIMGAEGDRQIGIQKAIAGAMAAINVAEGITKALTLGGALGWAQAAAVAAAGAAQIAVINRMGKVGGSVTAPSGSGGGASSAPSAAPVASQPAAPTIVHVNMVGKSRVDELRELIEDLNEMFRDGYKVIFS